MGCGAFFILLAVVGALQILGMSSHAAIVIFAIIGLAPFSLQTMALIGDVLRMVAHDDDYHHDYSYGGILVFIIIWAATTITLSEYTRLESDLDIIIGYIVAIFTVLWIRIGELLYRIFG